MINLLLNSSNLANLLIGILRDKDFVLIGR